MQLSMREHKGDLKAYFDEIVLVGTFSPNMSLIRKVQICIHVFLIAVGVVW
jgi:hypothetical protein